MQYVGAMSTEYAELNAIRLRPDKAFNGVKIFSATMVAERNVLGEKITQWMADNKHLDVTEIVIKQSSDSRFHCVAFAVFYHEEKRAA